MSKNNNYTAQQLSSDGDDIDLHGGAGADKDKNYEDDDKQSNTIM